MPAAVARSAVGVDPAYCAAGEGQSGAEPVYHGADRGAIHAGSAGGAATALAVCEARLAYGLPALLPAKGGVFLGNSLTVRLADALAQLPAGYPVWGNRGVSGIDGLLATAAGVARGPPPGRCSRYWGTFRRCTMSIRWRCSAIARRRW